MTTDTNVQNLIINKLTKAQYEGITNPSETELYLTPDESISANDLKTINGNSLVGSGNININSRNIGEIVWSSLPLTDAGVHLLDGTMLPGGGVYDDFVQYIAELYKDNPGANYFTTESDWQTSVATYGVCGKFVYDSGANTVRLPKITGVIEGTTDVAALGSLVEAGLPNITGSWATASDGTQLSASVYEIQNYGGNQFSRGSSGWGVARKLGLDASLSSSIYGNSDTVQPQTIKAFVYIVIAATTKTEIEADIDNIVTDLNGKADVDLTNTTDTGKVLMSGMGMPSTVYNDLTLGTSGSTYTAPANGWFALSKQTTAANQQISLTCWRNNATAYSTKSMSAAGNSCNCILPVLKGEIVRADYNAGGSTGVFRFIYAQGSESEFV